jgi:hypothetical protein
MIVAQLINQIRVGKDYAMEIDLNVSYEMFVELLHVKQPDDNAEEVNNMKESA